MRNRTGCPQRFLGQISWQFATRIRWRGRWRTISKRLKANCSNFSRRAQKVKRLDDESYRVSVVNAYVQRTPPSPASHIAWCVYFGHLGATKAQESWLAQVGRVIWVTKNACPCAHMHARREGRCCAWEVRSRSRVLVLWCTQFEDNFSGLFVTWKSSRIGVPTAKAESTDFRPIRTRYNHPRGK